MSEYATDMSSDYCLLIGRMVYDEVEWSCEHIPFMFDENNFWLDAMAQRFYECRLEAYGCFDADL
jgi:hypothetical protein